MEYAKKLYTENMKNKESKSDKDSESKLYEHKEPKTTETKYIDESKEIISASTPKLRKSSTLLFRGSKGKWRDLKKESETEL